MDFSKMLHRYTVIPSLSEELSGLQKIAYNLWWTWEPEAMDLFRRIDPDLWEKTGHNPVEVLGLLQQAALDNLRSDEGFMAHLGRVDAKLKEYMTSRSWFDRNFRGEGALHAAYFSMEF